VSRADATALLAALQVADTAFPSGGFAYSWGLEAAAAEGVVDRASFGDWLEGEMAGRWTGFDRPLVAAAFRAADAEAVLAIDLRADRAFWAETLRRQSAEAGQAFLAAAARLGDPAATALRAAALEGRGAVHLPVAQGAVFRSLGLSETLALAASSHAARQSLAGAAVRLGLAGAIEAQRTIARLGPGMSAGLEPPTDMAPAPFAPLSEIAALRPPETRLFAN